MSYAHLFNRFNHPVDTAGWGFCSSRYIKAGQSNGGLLTVYSQNSGYYSVFYIQGALGQDLRVTSSVHWEQAKVS